MATNNADWFVPPSYPVPAVFAPRTIAVEPVNVIPFDWLHRNPFYYFTPWFPYNKDYSAYPVYGYYHAPTLPSFDWHEFTQYNFSYLQLQAQELIASMAKFAPSFIFLSSFASPTYTINYYRDNLDDV